MVNYGWVRPKDLLEQDHLVVSTLEGIWFFKSNIKENEK